MCPSNIKATAHPEWYTLEKDTEKTIRKLMSIKDLDFYLKNSDEYIRRLAILRLNELSLKDSIGLLKDIMDDQTESSSNKELAAWTLKVISFKHNSDLFISSRLLNKFSGKEKYNDVFRINIKESLPDIRFKFTTYLLDSELKSDGTGTRLGEGIDLDMPFSVKEWLNTFSDDIISGLKKQFISLPGKLANIIKIVLASVFIRFPRFLAVSVKNIISKHQASKGYHSSRNTGYNAAYRGSESFSESFKKIAVNILLVIFFPVRFTIKHIKSFAVLVILLYCFLTFTTPGRVLLYNRYGIDLKEVHANLFYSGKEFMTYAWDEFKNVTGLSVAFANGAVQEDDSAAASPNSAEKASSGIQYRVTAKKGLNLREAPDASSKKVVDESLKFNSVITYLSQSKEDASGTEWYLIETADGEKGWVSSKWIEKVEG